MSSTSNTLGRDADPAKEPEYIWCDNCEAVRPCVRDYMPGGGPNQHAATDLLCGECRLIIATLHHVPAPPVAAKES